MAPRFLSHALSFSVGLAAVVLYFIFLREAPCPTPDCQTADRNIPRFLTTMSEPEAYTLPELPYQYHALEPHISAQIMELHHSKHHQTYITNLNSALQHLHKAVSSSDGPAQVLLHPAIRFNGGGHINHSLFWKNLCPASSPDAKSSAAPTLQEAITVAWGGEQAFRDAFKKVLLGIQGSGWGWLIKAKGKDGRPDSLRIIATKDQDPVIGEGQIPVIGIDMWEHAYYLQYLNGKAAYVDNIWNIINWKTAEERFLETHGDSFRELKALLA